MTIGVPLPRPPHFLTAQTTTAARFVITCEGWTAGIGFSELAGFSSAVAHQEYTYNGLVGNVHTKQFGRVTPPSLSLKRGLDALGFAQFLGWHTLARTNNPLAKLPAFFSMLDAAGTPVMNCVLENAWCARLELDSAQAGSSNVVMMKATIECDAILQI